MNEERMNDEFEALPFAAGGSEAEAGTAAEWTNESANEWANEWQGEDEGESEEERGRMSMGGRGGMGRGGPRPVYRAGARPGRGPVARPSRPQGKPRPPQGPRPGPRPGRWPRGPYWGPFYGGWPGGVMVSEPMGYPLPAPAAEPAAEPDDRPAPPIETIDLPAADGGDADGPQEEMPATLRAVIGSLATAAPAFRYVGRLDNVRNLGLPRKPGFYLITFRQGNAWKAYNGQTGNLHERLVKHRLGATVLGLPVAGHHVYIAESARPEPARRNIEMAINRAMLQNHPGVLTNQNAELEMELLGWD